MPVKYKRLSTEQKKKNLEARRVREGKAEHKKIGRPKKSPPPEAVEGLAALHCTDIELAAGLGIAVNTLYARIKDDPEFAAAIERGKANGMIELRKLQMQHARTPGSPGVVMTKFISGPILGQYERPLETKQTVDVKIEISSANERIAYKLDQLRERIMGSGQPPVLPELQVLGDVSTPTEADGEFVESGVAGVEVDGGAEGVRGQSVGGGSEGT